MTIVRDSDAANAELRKIRDGVSCALVLEQEGFRIDIRESGRSSQKYRSADGRSLIVNHEGRGWWDPHDSAAKGDVFKLLQYLQPGLTLGHARQKLRPMIGLLPQQIPAVRSACSNRPVAAVPERWARLKAMREGSPAWRYLTQVRALPVEIVRAAIRQDIVREGWGATACFAHRNADGILTSFEMRGPNFRGCPADSTKTLFRFGGGDGLVRRVVVTEAAIDALSVASLDLTREGSLYLSTAGGIGPEGIASLKALFAGATSAHLLIALDQGTGGDRMAATLTALADATGIVHTRVMPFEGQKDWNAVLQSRRGSMA